MNATEQTTAATEIRTVLDRLYAAWSDGDADAFAARYIDDATVAMPGAFAGPLAGSRGIDDVREIRVLGGRLTRVDPGGPESDDDAVRGRYGGGHVGDVEHVHVSVVVESHRSRRTGHHVHVLRSRSGRPGPGLSSAVGLRRSPDMPGPDSDPNHTRDDACPGSRCGI